jgi:hypothetical protein
MVGEFEAWNIIIGAIITPAATIAAAAITASGFIISTAIVGNIAQQALVGQQDLQKQIIEKIPAPSPKFF